MNRRRKPSKNCIQVKEVVIKVITSAIFIWIVISFFDVNLHNGFNGTGPAPWNFFKLITSWLHFIVM